MGASVIVVLVGLPAAGKSTFSKFCKDSLHNCQVTIFHYDDLCKLFSAEERKFVLHQVEEFVLKSKDTKSSSSTNTNVIIIDDNNYYTSMQTEYLKLCKRLNLGYVVVYLKISVANALKQNTLRNVKKQVPNDVIREMYSKLEKPKGAHVICIDVDQLIENSTQQYQLDLQLLRNKIEEASNNPLVFEEPHVVIPLQQCLLQKVDIALRKIVNTKIRSLEDKTLAQDIVVLKKQVYMKICSKEIILPAFSSLDVDNHINVLENELGQYFDV